MTLREHVGTSFSRLRHDGDLRLLLVASEIYPLAKTGGLADVCAALPRELGQLGVDVRLMMPGYPQAMEQIHGGTIIDLGEVLPGYPVHLVEGRMPDSELPVWLVDCPSLYQRGGKLYQDEHGREWHDNALRFGLLSHAAALVAGGCEALDWAPDIVHAHDWHTGLVPLLVRNRGSRHPPVVFTIHNMAFQGLFPLDCAEQLELPQDVMTTDDIEFYGWLSFLKAGIRFADRVTTVSPNYAHEIRTPEFGFGMEGLLRHRGEDLIGIMNGVDTGLWNPSTDVHLPQRYDKGHMAGKVACKAALQEQLGLYVDAAAPLAVSISRLTHQKMADLLLQQLPSMLIRHPHLQVAVHGRGEYQLEEGFLKLAQEFPKRLFVDIGYEEDLAHRMHAGADFLLHGSRFEPCGLAQQYAMRYGTLPVVSRVGGLADSVVDASDSPLHANGFVFDERSGEALEKAVDRCLETFLSHPETWRNMQRRGMSKEIGWTRSALEYAYVYASLVTGYTPHSHFVKVTGEDWSGLRLVSNE